MTNHEIQVNWSFGFKEIFKFSSVKEREDWLDLRQEDIDSVVINPVSKSIITKSLDTLDFNMSDYEMDMYL